MTQPYQNVLGCLQRWKCLLPGEETLIPEKEYTIIPFSPQAIVGLLIHTLLSSRPRSNFHTDGKKIYYEKDQQVYLPYAQQQEDIIREYEIAKILSYPSARSYDEFMGRYGKHDGHLRLNKFEDAFQSTSSNEDARFITHNGLTEVIQGEERHLIKARLRKNLPQVKELVSALKQDEPPLPAYAEKLMEALSEYEPTIYSYNPNRSIIVAA